jgi:hypothetical protein
MKLLKSIILVAILAGTNSVAMADTVTNLSVGPLPTSLNYGDSFVAASSGQTFWDAYYFTIPAGTANTVASSINLSTILGLTDLKARLYAGNTNDTTNSVPNIISAWGSVANFGAVNVQTVVLDPVTLLAGAYTLQIMGTVSGSSGGSYAGVLNIASPAPVPETETYAMFLAGLGIMSAIARRRKNS